LKLFIILYFLISFAGLAALQAGSKSLSDVHAALGKRQYTEAVAICDTLIEADRSDPVPYYYRATAAWSNGNVAAALADLSRCLACDASYAPALQQRARLQLQCGAFKDALADAEALASLLPPEKKTEAIEIEKEAQAAAASLRALEAAAAAKDHKRVLSLAEKLQRVAQFSPLVFRLQAEAYAALDQPDPALKSFRRAATLEPSWRLFLCAASLHFARGEMADGLENLRSCVHFAPDEPHCTALYSHLRRQQKKWVALEEVAAGRPRITEALRLLGELEDAVRDIPRQPWFDAALPRAAALYTAFDIRGAATLCLQYARLKDPAAASYCDKVLASNLNLKSDPKSDLSADSDFPFRLEDLLQARVSIFLLADDFEAAKRFLTQQEDVWAADAGIQARIAKLKKDVEAALAKPADYYKELGLSRGEDDQRAIKKAYYRLAQQWHPDKHTEPADKEKANLKMAKLNKAYEVLSDPEAKRKYDQFNIDPNNPHQAQHGNPFGGGGGSASGFDMSDLFNQFMGGGGGGGRFPFGAGGAGGFPFGAGSSHHQKRQKEKSKKKKAAGDNPFGNPFGNFDFHFDL
jgi:DnaJ homolog subfamily C member 3